MPITYRHGHIFITWIANEIFFKRSELWTLLIHCLQPNTNKLFNLLRRAYPNSTISSVKKVFPEIEISCEECRERSPSPLQSEAVIPSENILFNHKIAMDLMWIEGIPIIHIIDTHNGFQNAAVLRGKNSNDIWKCTVECWTYIYRRYPNRIRLDREFVFAARAFRNLFPPMK